MKTVLVTGADGFVGRNLCPYLKSRDLSVRGSVVEIKTSPCLLDGVEYVETGFMTQHTDWQPALKDVDVVVHLAARVHIMQETAADPLLEFRKVNVVPTLQLAKQAAQAGVKKFVFMSTVKVNGEGDSQLKRAIYKESDPANPQDAYGLSKLEAEKQLSIISQETGMQLITIRPPLIYGPGVGANFLKLINLVQKGLPLPFSIIRNKRSFLYVENLADAIYNICIKDINTNDVFFVSDQNDMSIAELVKVIATVSHRNVFLMPLPGSLLRVAAKLLGKADMISRLVDSLVVDTAKIKSTLNWHAPYSVLQGLTKTIAWHEAQIKK